ncbi:hypothetical protein M9H77_23579 [Catharanthus roseus]|uniref:Uncharacterized protein n=1 Tax=Catharanthus roseus TaxID=4058 RepID=A0ACC0AU53_CATRO|nr:hypothetical protein M9H77_23579 [Catharanthus roseus]
MILSMSFLLTRYKRDFRESLSPLISSLRKGDVRAEDVKSMVYKGILYYLSLQEWNELFLGFGSNVVEKELSLDVAGNEFRRCNPPVLSMILNRLFSPRTRLRTRSFIPISPPIIFVTL